MEQPEAKSGPGMAQPSRAQAEGAPDSSAATAGAKDLRHHLLPVSGGAWGGRNHGVDGNECISHPARSDDQRLVVCRQGLCKCSDSRHYRIGNKGKGCVMADDVLQHYGLTEADRLGSGWESRIYALGQDRILRIPSPNPMRRPVSGHVPPLPIACPRCPLLCHGCARSHPSVVCW